MARAKPDGEIAARAPPGAAAVAAAAGHVKVAVVEAGPTKLTPRADVTSEIRLPIVAVLLPAKSSAMGLNRVSSHDQGTGIAAGAE